MEREYCFLFFLWINIGERVCLRAENIRRRDEGDGEKMSSIKF